MGCTTEESWFSFLQRNVRTSSEAQPAPIQLLPAAAFPGLERPGCKADHSPPTSAEVKNEWNYTSAPSVCLHNVYRNNFSFTMFSQQCRVSVFLGYGAASMYNWSSTFRQGVFFSSFQPLKVRPPWRVEIPGTSFPVTRVTSR
jgi:hypothetical protein